MTKESLVQQARLKNPSLNNVSTDEAYYLIKQQYPEIENQISNASYAPVKKEDKSIWNNLPDFIKDGYNNSLQGMASEMTTGNKRFDLKDYEPGIVGDLGASIASFFVPGDLITTALTGGVGGAVSKELVKKYVFKKLVRNNVSKKVALTSAKKAGEFAMSAGASASGLGYYSGASEAFSQKINEGSIDPLGVVKEGVKGAVLGGLTGGTNAFLTQRGASTLTKVLAETTEFGLGTAAMEGRAPTPQDFFHAGGMLAGIKGVNYIGGKSFNKIKKWAKEGREPEYRLEKLPDTPEAREFLGVMSEAKADVSLGKIRQDTIYYDKAGRKIKVKTDKPGDDKIQFEFLDTKEVVVRPKSLFASEYTTAEKRSLSSFELKKARADEIRSAEKRLNVSPEEKITQRALKINKEGKRPELKNFTSEQLIEYRRELLQQITSKDYLSKMKKNGVSMVKPRYSMFLDKLLPAKATRLLDYIRPAKFQGTVDPYRRAYIASVNQFVLDHRGLSSKTYDLMNRSGFIEKKATNSQVRELANVLRLPKSQVRKNYWELLSKSVEDGLETQHGKEYKQIMDFLFDQSSRSGVDVSGYINKYIPQMLRQDVAKNIFEDIMKISESAFKKSSFMNDPELKKYTAKSEVFDLILEAMNNPEEFASKRKTEARFINKIVQRSLNQNKFSKETTSAYSHFLENYGKDMGELKSFKILSALGRQTYSEIFRMDGNLEKKRKYKLPSQFYERDIRNLLSIYSSNVSRRSAEVKNFGRQGEVKKKLIESAQSQGDKAIIQELHNHVLGTINYTRDYNWSPGVKNFATKVMEFETASKIALGSATAMNLSQFTISSALSGGYYRFVKGANKYHTDKEFKRQIDASGANLYKYVNELMGLSQSDNISNAWSSKITSGLVKVSGFDFVNSYNNILAASTARVLIDDLVSIVTKGSRIPGREKWARATLKRMGLEPSNFKQGKPSQESVLQGITKFAVESQLQKNILNDPLILNNPKLKPFLQFKSFVIRQTGFIKDTLKNDALYYNVFPMLRLAGAGFATGAVGLKAKELMREYTSGQKDYDPSKFLEVDGKEIIDNIASIGAFGYVGELLRVSLDENGGSPTRSLKFLAYPPFLSDIDNFFNRFLPAIESDWKNYEGDFYRRVPERLFVATGSPLLKDLAKQIETPGRTKSRIKAVRGRVKGQILQALIDSSTEKDYDNVMRRIEDFNKAYPLHPLTGNDINADEMYRKKIRKYQKQQDI